METGKTWNINDLDFDEEGRVLIKNTQLAAFLLSVLNDHGQVELWINPHPVPPPPPPDSMCGCVMRRERLPMAE